MKIINFGFISLLVILFFIGCTEKITDNFVFMSTLKRDISEKYNVKKIKIDLHNQNLTITLENSKFKSYNTDKKKEIVKEIGVLTLSLKKDKINIKTGVVKFLNTKNYLIWKSSQYESYKMF